LGGRSEFRNTQLLRPLEQPGEKLRQAFASLPPRAIDALNQSLKELGFSEYRVVAFDRISDVAGGEVSFAITIESANRSSETLDLKL